MKEFIRLDIIRDYSIISLFLNYTFCCSIENLIFENIQKQSHMEENLELKNVRINHFFQRQNPKLLIFCP